MTQAHGAALWPAWFSVALFHITSSLDLQIDFQTAASYREVQSLGLALLPFQSTPPPMSIFRRKRAARYRAPFNLLRNIGCSAGISLLETRIVRRAQFH